jgi:hypothetical protein
LDPLRVSAERGSPGSLSLSSNPIIQAEQWDLPDDFRK